MSYELTGSVRWVDRALDRIVLHPDDGGAHGGRFVGSDLTIDLSDAQVHGGALAEVTPGARMRVKLRLPRELGAALPELLAARSAQVLTA